MNTRTKRGTYNMTNEVLSEEGDVLTIDVSTNKYPEAHMKIDRADWDKVASDKRYGRVSAYRPTKRHGLYARCNDRVAKKLLVMHRLVLGEAATKCTDHINRNGLDNTRSNLRDASLSTNAINSSLSSRNTSGVKGVSFLKAEANHKKPWVASIKTKQVRKTKVFATKEEAIACRKEWELDTFGLKSPNTKREEIKVWDKASAIVAE